MLQEGFEKFLKKEGGSEKSEYLIPNAVGGLDRGGEGTGQGVGDPGKVGGDDLSRGQGDRVGLPQRPEPTRHLSRSAILSSCRLWL